MPALASAEFRLCSGCSHRGFGCERLQGADSGRSLLLCQIKEQPKVEVRAFELMHTNQTSLTTSVVKKKSNIEWKGFKVSTQQHLTVMLKPAFDQTRVHAPEIGRENQVAVFVEISQ